MFIYNINESIYLVYFLLIYLQLEKWAAGCNLTIDTIRLRFPQFTFSPRQTISGLSYSQQQSRM